MSYTKRVGQFKQEWLDKYFWLTAHPTSTVHAHCKLCKTDIHVGSIRLSAIESHKKGSKHAARETSKLTPKASIKNYFVTRSKDSGSDNSILAASASSLDLTVQEEQTKPSEPLATSSIELHPTPSNNHNQALVNYLNPEQVLKAEILWALHCTVSHTSFNYSKTISPLFAEMFPDSSIAQKFACGSMKLMYLVTFGLAPCFLNDIADQVKGLNHVVLLFDESFNRTTKNEQMDICLRYWSTEQDCVVSRYLTSCFLGHCTAKDLLRSFKEGTAMIDASKIIQVSMDGPNVNHKFYKMYTEERKNESPDASDLIDLSTCGLHVVHGAFKTGANATGWKIDSLLRSLWYLFADSPARREDYTAITDSKQFPLRFCSTRWVEDVPVAERAIDIWTNICRYIDSVCSRPKSKQPSSSSFAQVVKATHDVLTLPKLHAFVRIAKYLSPFLSSFQSDSPLVPFLATELYVVLNNLLESVANRSVMDSLSMSSVVTLDLDDKNVLKVPKKITIGFACNEALKKANLSEAKLVEFKTECRTFYVTTAKKMIERSPLGLPIVRNMACLNPKTISTEHSDKQIKMFDNILSKMVRLKLLKTGECDDLIDEHKCFIKFIQQEHKEEFMEFSMSEGTRLDNFLQKFLEKPKYLKLWNFVKTLLILSHGQASVERGFSVNKDILRTNLTEKNLVALRLVSDSVQLQLLGNKSADLRSVHKLNITKDIIANCKLARSRYQNYLDQKKEESKKEESEKRKIRLLGELSESKAKKLKLENTSKRLMVEVDELFIRAEKERNFDLLSSANDLKKKVKIAEKEISNEVDAIKCLKEKLNSL